MRMRFYAASGVFIVVTMALTIFLAMGLVAGLLPAGNLLAGVLLAMDDTVFIGVMTNVLFGLIVDISARQRMAWPWASGAAFWGTNVGLAGFVVGLIATISLLERIITPIMGLGILLAIVAYAPMLLRGPAKAPIASTT